MKTGLIRLVVAGMMLAGSGLAMAKENGEPKAAKAPAKAKTWKGELSAPAAEAGADVVAILTVKQGEATKTYNLTATDAEVVAKIKEGTGSGAVMTVAGEMNADETAIAVTKVMAAAADKPKGDKPKKEAKPAQH